MMVAYRHDLRVVHAHAHDLPQFLDEGDLVVVNTSGTLAAAVDALGEDGTPLVRAPVAAAPGRPVARRAAAPRRRCDPTLVRRTAGPRRCGWWAAARPARARFETSQRLWVATLDLAEPVLTYLAVHGRPIRYGYVTRDWPLDVYQNVYAREPGSAEMPSAGRPFTPELITRLVAKGVGVTPLVLHTGVSSLEANEHPYPEWYRVRAGDGGAVNETHAARRTRHRDRHDGRARARDGRRSIGRRARRAKAGPI